MMKLKTSLRLSCLYPVLLSGASPPGESERWKRQIGKPFTVIPLACHLSRGNSFCISVMFYWFIGGVRMIHLSPSRREIWVLFDAFWLNNPGINRSQGVSRWDGGGCGRSAAEAASEWRCLAWLGLAWLGRWWHDVSSAETLTYSKTKSSICNV